MRSSLRAAVGVVMLGSVWIPAVVSGQEADVSALEDGVSELTRVQQELSRIATLTEEGADSTLVALQLWLRWQEHHRAVRRLADVLSATDGGGEAARTSLRSALSDELGAFPPWVGRLDGAATRLRDASAGSAGSDRVALEVDLSRSVARADTLIMSIGDAVEWSDSLGFPIGSAGTQLETTLRERARLTNALVEESLFQIEDFRERRSVVGIDTTSVDLTVAAIQERLTTMSRSLEITATELERRGVDASAYRQTVVMATGALTPEDLNTQVIGGLVSEWWERASSWVRENAGSMLMRLLGIVAVIFAASRLVGVARGLAKRLVDRFTLTSLIQNLVVSGVGKLVWLVALFAVLSLMGFDLGPMLAGLGIAGFVIGFALQDTLSNFAAGMMIMIYRPFDVGDFVTAGGVTGDVQDLTLVSTLIRTRDNQRIIVPNASVWGQVINNATAESIRRVDLVFGVSYSDDVDRAREVLESVLAQDDFVLDDPEPVVRVSNLGASSVDLVCRPWCRTDDYWEAYWSVTRAVKKRFDAEGISFPFPQRDVHLYHETSIPPLDPFSGKPTE